MKRLLNIILILFFIVAISFLVRHIHGVYASLWLDLYIILLISLPLFAGFRDLILGSQDIKSFSRIFLFTTANLVVTKLIWDNLIENWFLACLASVVIVGIGIIAFNWYLLSAQNKLSMAEQALKGRSNIKQAIELAQEACSIYETKGYRERQASAEEFLGIVYTNTRERSRAEKHLKTALDLYYTLGKTEQTQQVLQTLHRIGINVTPEVVDNSTRIGLDWHFFLHGIFSVIFLLILPQLWNIEVFQASLSVTVAFGILLLLFIYGNYAICTRSASIKQRSTRTLILYNLFLLGLTITLIGGLLKHSLLQNTDFPSIVRIPLTFPLLERTWPVWGGVTAILALLGVLWRDSATELGESIFSKLWSGGTQRQTLQLAMRYLNDKEWKQGISQLTKIDLTKAKDQTLHNEILFYLSFAHYMLEHVKEAQAYVKELLSKNPQHKSGLYLAGYMELARLDKLEKTDLIQENQYGVAEELWRNLYELDSNFCPFYDTEKHQNARYYLSLTLYRKSMILIKKDFEKGTQLLSEVSELGSLNQKVSEILIRIHLYRYASMIRQDEFTNAEHEVKLAKNKLGYLNKIIEDQFEKSKIKGLCHAAEGLASFRQENYKIAENIFLEALKETNKIAKKGSFFNKKSSSLLEQLLNSVIEEKEDNSKIHPYFTRDLLFLQGIIQIRILSSKLEQSFSSGLRESILQIESKIEQSLAIDKNFNEGRAMLGLLYYYCHFGDNNKQEKGIELLQTIRTRISSKFVSRTLRDYEAEKLNQGDAKKAYFEMLQQYLTSSSIPAKQRLEMRDQVLEDMKLTGEYEAFVGQNGLSVNDEREREPTVKEYIIRVALLREKLEKLKQLDKSGELPSDVKILMEDLSKYNQNLQEQIDNISKIEKQLLIKAQKLI